MRRLRGPPLVRLVVENLDLLLLLAILALISSYWSINFILLVFGYILLHNYFKSGKKPTKKNGLVRKTASEILNRLIKHFTL